MKKIKYGSRDKTKEKKNNFIQELKDDDDDVCGAVLDSFSNDYLSYISGLVKASKTPPKMKTEQRIDALFQNKEKQKQTQIKAAPISIVNKQKSKQFSPQSPKSYSDIKNSTVPIKNMKQLIKNNEIGNRRQREKSSGSVLESNNYTNIKLDKNFNLKQHYNRFPTQEGQKIGKNKKYDDTSIVCSEQVQKRQEYLQNQAQRKQQPSKQFLQGLNQYLVTLESHRNNNFNINNENRKGQQRRNSKSKKNDDDIRTVQQLFQDNLKLRKKIKKYEEKIIQIQDNMENHFVQDFIYLGSHCKRQDKSQKIKINDLTKALLRAISKVNQQRQEIEELKYQLKSFSRKAQYCVEKYEQSSEQQMHEELIKVIRPSRANSQYKLKRKRQEINTVEFLGKID